MENSATRSKAGKVSADKQKENPSMDEGSVRRRFQSTLTGDPETREKYLRYVKDLGMVKLTYNDIYRGIIRR